MAVNISPYPRSPPFPPKAPLQLFDANTPIAITKHAETMGVAQQSTFASEFGAENACFSQVFTEKIPSPRQARDKHKETLRKEMRFLSAGCSVFSSFESIAPTLAPEHWGVHGGAPQADCREPDITNAFWRDCKGKDGAPENVMAERNYPCDPLIIVYFGLSGSELDATGEAAFKRQLYLCMLGQAIEMKADIETRRASNTFGTWTWQLNEIWPTGGWGSLEYGTTATATTSVTDGSSSGGGEPFTAGQVLGGAESAL